MSQTATDTAMNTSPGMGLSPASARSAGRSQDTGQNALYQALIRPRYELIPMRGALAQAGKLPAGATVSVTCSPRRGIAATIELAEQIQRQGYTAVPHLAARRFHSRAHLDETMARLSAAGVQDVFVVGGDGRDQAGPFACGADLIAALAEIQPGLRSVGIPCYPEGHAFIGSEVLDAALDDKCFFAGYMVTQICFDAGVISDWLARTRARGVELPVYIGIPGMIERRKLLGIALRIGLGDSTRFLKKNSGFMGRFAGPSRFTPDALVSGLAPLIEAAESGIAGFHINTFNQVESTEIWRREQLGCLAEAIDDGRQAMSSSGSYYQR